MLKVLFAISLVSLMACGSEQSDSGAMSGAPGTPPVSAAAPSSKEKAAAPMNAAKSVEGKQADVQAAAPAVRSCLDLVAAAKFEDAMPVCLEAASIAPENTDVKAALAKAKAETSKAATGAASDAAAGAAADALGNLGN